MAAYDRPAGTWAGLCWPQFAKVVSALAPVAVPLIPTVAMAPTSEMYCKRRTNRRGRVARAQPSAHRFLHEGADPCLVGGGQLLQREGDWPQAAFVQVRPVAEPERRVPRLELLRGLEETDDLAVLGIRG